MTQGIALKESPHLSAPRFTLRPTTLHPVPLYDDGGMAVPSPGRHDRLAARGNGAIR
jgi:hypothetical protein